PEILVGTPGRVLELMQKKKLKSHQLKAVVFDEADQLLQDETLPLVSNILKIVPNTVQFGFFSATAGEVLPQIKDLVSENLEVVDVTKEDQSQGVINHYRSEEHTSELQSRFDIVCRLLLEKKNN